MKSSHLPEDAGSSEMITALDRIEGEGKTARDQWGNWWDKDLADYRGNLSKGSDVTPPRKFAADVSRSAIRRRASLLSEGKPVNDIVPRRPNLDACAAILKSATMGVWDSQQFQLSIESILAYKGIFGAGGIRTRWQRDPRFGFGEITLSPVDPRNIIIDPAITRAAEINRGQYIRIESVVPLGELKAQYPAVADQIKPSLIVRSTDKERGWGGALRSLFKGATENPDEAVPRVLLQEYFLFDPRTDDNDAPLYPNGRYIVRANDLVLNPDADANPYFDGMSDLDLFDNDPDPEHPWGYSEVEALKQIARSFNEIGELLSRAYIRNGYPWIVADRNALDNVTIQKLRDREQMVLEKAGGREVVRTPGAMPGSDGINLLQLMLQLVDQMEGLTDPGMQGKGRVELRSGQQVEGLQEIAQVLIRAEARRLEALLERVGQKIVSRIFQFYDDERMVTYYGGGVKFLQYKFERDKLVQEIVAYGVERATKAAKEDHREPGVDEMADAILLSIKQAWRDFQFKIIPYSSLSSTKIRRFMLKLQLAQAGGIPMSEALQELGIENPEEKVQQAAKEAAFRQGLGFGGQPPPKKKGGSK